jgi:hypothetical protein
MMMWNVLSILLISLIGLPSFLIVKAFSRSLKQRLEALDRPVKRCQEQDMHILRGYSMMNLGDRGERIKGRNMTYNKDTENAHGVKQK